MNPQVPELQGTPRQGERGADHRAACFPEKPKEEEEEMEGVARGVRGQGALSPRGRDGLAAVGQRAPAHPGARSCHSDPQAVFVDVVFLRCFAPPHCSGLPSLLRWLPWAPYHSFAICGCHPTPRAAL